VRVLFSSTGGYGHIYPMVPLAKALVAAGHDVLWATPAPEVVTAAGLAAVSAGPAGAELFELVRPVVAAGAKLAPPDRAAFMFPSMFAEVLAPPMVADLLPLARRWQPDLLVHEHGELASPLVGALLGRPSLTHAFGGAVPAEFLAEAGRRLSPVWTAHGLDIPLYAGCFESLYLDICPPAVQVVPMGHITQVQALRPVADTGAEPQPLPVQPDADGRPLVYLTLGTVHNHAGFLGPVVAALAELPVRLLVTVGRDGDPAAVGPQPDNVRVERWVDQPAVLRGCDLVVSHGGSGTFLGALAVGRPQLCLPQAADQFRNAQGGVSSGAALALPPGSTPDEVVAAVRRLLDEPGFRACAAAVRAEIEAMPSPAEVARLLVAWSRQG
jgi:UDP:flavonoid glycosyltransferase YjiC (YdhE family)